MSRCLRAAMWSAVAFAALVTAFPAAAAPVLRYNWDRCEPLVRNQDYAGPGLYRQTLSITDLPAGTTHLYFNVEVLVDSWYRAWEFFPGGCAGEARLSVVPVTPDCDSIPGLEVIIAQLAHSPDAGFNLLNIVCTLDPGFTPEPGRRYGVATITFDHALAETDCYGADAPLCFLLEPGLLQVGGTFDFSMTSETDRLTWNDHSAVPDCTPRMTPFPARPSSWGEVKSRYR